MARRRDWHDAQFASDVESSMVQGPNPSLYTIFILIICLLVAAFFWAYAAEVDEVTRGEGRVIPSSKIQIVQNLEGGILKEVFVKEGATVREGEVLLRIDDTGVAASYGELRANRFALLGRVARLTAQAENKPLHFPPELTAEARDIASNEEQLFNASESALQSQISILRVQADQRKQEMAELRAKLDKLRTSLGLANEELELTEPLARSGIVPAIDLIRIKRQVADLAGEYRTTQLSVPRARSALQEANRRIEEKFNTRRTESLTELNQSRGELAQIEETIRAARDRVMRTDVVSPVNGIIKELKVRTVGGVIKPGMDLVEIVPVDDTLLVEARIRPADIAFLSLNQVATVKLTAYDFSIYGGLDGRLERISADTITDDEGESFYHVIIRTDQNYLERRGEKLPIIPGMVASVDVLTGRKTILDYLLKPILKARNKALSER